MAPDHLAQGIEALRRQKPEEALAALDAALETPLSLPLLARVYSLRAQAKLQCGDLGGAMVDWRASWTRVLDLEDEEGQLALKNLRAQIAQARARQSAEKAQRRQSAQTLKGSLTEDLEQSTGFEERLNVLLEHANAHMDCEQITQGLALAEQALAEADKAKIPVVRVQVLARLCVLRAQPERSPELLEAAFTLADNADEPQLIGAVARAAKALGHVFQAPEF